jgi:hypothetical protein
MSPALSAAKVLRRAVVAVGLTLASAALFAAVNPSPAEAKCAAGSWQNSDGTCTFTNFVHCNMGGRQWQCPRTTPICSINNGRTSCKRG